MIKITGVRHAFPEKAGFTILRKEGHRDYTFLHFITPIQMEIEGERQSLPAHAVMMYAPGTPQFFHSDARVLHDWMHLRGDVAALLVKNGIETDRLYFPSTTNFITAILRELEAEFFSETADSDRLTALKLEELFLKLSRAISSVAPSLDKETKEKLRALRGKILSTPEHRWTVTEMADGVHLSASRFQVVYKGLFGISPMRDLIGARVERAKSLLLSSDAPVGEVAQTVGYDNVSHFVRQFKEAVGVSPRAYRKLRSGVARK